MLAFLVLYRKLWVGPRDIPHAVKAAPDEEFQILVVKTPNPKENIK